MELHLRDKVALITGGSKGLGAACAERLAAEGARIMLAARSEEALRTTARDIARRHGVAAETLAVDLTAPDGAAQLAETTLQAFGHIDVLVNAAGSSMGGLFWELDDEVWAQSFALKFMGYVRTMRAVLPAMLEQGSGRIVNIVGNSGRQPLARMLPGGSANAALLNVTKGVADEVAPHGIVVTAVNPGPIRTERWGQLMRNQAESYGITPEEAEARFVKDIPSGRIGEPDEVARLVTFLASEAAGNLTGISVTVDGGMTRALA